MLTGTVTGPPKVVFPNTGLNTSLAASWVLGQGRLAWGADNQLWAYDDGVWVPGEDPARDIVHERIARLLGRRFPPGARHQHQGDVPRPGEVPAL